MIERIAEWLGWKCWAARGPLLRWGSRLLRWAADRREAVRAAERAKIFGPPPPPLTTEQIRAAVAASHAKMRQELSDQIYGGTGASESPFFKRGGEGQCQ